VTASKVPRPEHARDVEPSWRPTKLLPGSCLRIAQSSVHIWLQMKMMKIVETLLVAKRVLISSVHPSGGDIGGRPRTMNERVEDLVERRRH